MQSEAAKPFFFCGRLTARLWGSGHMGNSLGPAAHEHLLPDGGLEWTRWSGWALPPAPLTSTLLLCPQQEDGFYSDRGREGVSCSRGAAGRGQHHYSGESWSNGSTEVWWGGGSPRPWVYVLRALIPDPKGDPSYLSLQREQPVPRESFLSVTESST